MSLNTCEHPRKQEFMQQIVPMIVTTVIDPSAGAVALAYDMAAHFSVPFVERGKQSLPFLQKQYQVELVAVAGQQGPHIVTPGGKFFFHLSMAELRIKNIVNGKPDHMVEAMGLQPGMSVLDCTAGLGTDLLVASFVSGSQGQVRGLEASAAICYLTAHGCQHFISEDAKYTEALRRITLCQADYTDYLSQQPADSVDIVYFDPMFRQPIASSSNLKPLRYLADDRALSNDAVTEAIRVARQRVVIKETRHSREFLRFPLTAIQGGKYSSVHYGIIDKQDAGYVTDRMEDSV